MFVYLRLLPECSLSCRVGVGCACPAALPGSRGPRLSLVAWKEIVSGLAGDGTRLLYVTDGNPLPCADLWPLVEYAAGLGLRVRVTVPAEAVEEGLCEQAVDAGLDAVQVRLGGLTASAHDALRWPGATAAAWKGIELLTGRGLAVHVIVPVLAINAAEIPRLLTRLAGMGIRELALTRPLGGGFIPGRAEGILPSPEVYRTTVLDALRHRGEGPGTPARRGEGLFVKTADPVFCRWDEALMSRLEEIRAAEPAAEAACLGGCLAGRDIVFLDYDGAAYPCRFLPVPSGSVASGYNPEHLFGAPLRRTWRPDLEGRCKDCPMRPVCGGCRAHAWEVSGDPLGADPWCGAMSADADEQDRGGVDA